LGDLKWSLDKKLAAVKAAGFEGFTTAATAEHAPLARKHRLFVIGYVSSGNPKEFAKKLRANKAAGAHYINVQLADHDTPTAEALALTIMMLNEAEKLGLEAAIEVHRDTCTETPEKSYALADAYQHVTGELLPMTWDFSHFAVVKHLWPQDFAKRLLVRPDLIQCADQIHLRPFNGHHCQVPVTDGRGTLTPEVKDYLVFVEALLKCWLAGNRNNGRRLYVCPEMGPINPANYNISTWPNSWEDAQVLQGQIDRLWRKLTA
jgi:hypothetical protein